MDSHYIRAQALTLTKAHEERAGPLSGIAKSIKLYVGIITGPATRPGCRVGSRTGRVGFRIFDPCRTRTRSGGLWVFSGFISGFRPIASNILTSHSE